MTTIEFYLIRKYLQFDKSQPFISISAILAFVGVLVGVAILMISMSLMNGMSSEFQKRLFTMNYPLTINSSFLDPLNDSVLHRLEADFPDMKFSPFIKSDAIVKYGGDMSGLVVFGVDFQKEKLVNTIVNQAMDDKPINKFDIILGKGIHNSFYLLTGQSNLEKVQLIFTQTKPIGFTFLPTIKNFNVAGYFKSGLIAYDKAYGYTTLEALHTIKGTKHYDGIHIYTPFPFKDKEAIKKKYEDLHIVGWWEQNGNFFEAQQLEKKALFIILMTIILIASLNIISSLLMTIMSRRKEIALLLSLGMSKYQIKKTFFLFGFILGATGIVIGVIFGFIGMYMLENFDIISLPADVYGTNTLPIKLDILDFIYILVGSFSIVIMSSIYPAFQASKMNVIDVLRYE